MEIWTDYRVALQVDGQFGASIPRSVDEIRKMLEHRMPGRKPEGAVPIEELTEQVAAEVGAAADDEFTPGWATFKRDEQGLLYEARCVRGHIKDCAQQVVPFFPGVKAFRAKVVNSVYIKPNVFHVMRGGAPILEVNGAEERFIQVMTRQGPRSSIKYVVYVIDPVLEFTLRLRTKGEIEKEHLDAIFEYGGTHGIGAERSQEWGQYSVLSFEPVGEEVVAK